MEGRRALRERLEARLPDLEAAIAARIFSIAPPDASTDPAYLEGLRNSLRTALGYALEAVEAGEQRAPEVPPSLFAQARMAARTGIKLDTVLRRYLAGFSVLTEFVLEDAVHAGLPKGTLRELLRGQTATLDRLLAAVSEEYVREESSRRSSEEQRRAERVKRLLAGEPLDVSTFDYDFDAWHTGLVVLGFDSAKAVREIARRLDARLLMVRSEESTAWVWLGSRREIPPADLVAAIGRIGSGELRFSVGEPGRGIEGWRAAHKQALAAVPIALRRRSEPVTLYSDDPVLAAALADTLLRESLEGLYLRPLQAAGNAGDLIQALRAYFSADCNVSSAAAALGLSRNTVSSRIRAAEKRLERSISACRAGLELALDLDRLERYENDQSADRGATSLAT